MGLDQTKDFPGYYAIEDRAGQLCCLRPQPMNVNIAAIALNRGDAERMAKFFNSAFPDRTPHRVRQVTMMHAVA